jgi:hypothetical protein
MSPGSDRAGQLGQRRLADEKAAGGGLTLVLAAAVIADRRLLARGG